MCGPSPNYPLPAKASSLCYKHCKQRANKKSDPEIDTYSCPHRRHKERKYSLIAARMRPGDSCPGRNCHSRGYELKS